MPQLNLEQLTPYSTLASLSSHSFQVDISTLGQAVSETFKNQPELPGVILMNGSQIVGMISQKTFLERMSQPYSLELFLKRPIQILLNTIKTDFLQLPVRCKIEQAARIALDRPAKLVYEPLIIVQENQELTLLDIHTLLLAQSQILASANNLIQEKHQQSKQYLEQLKEEQQKVKTYTLLLETKHSESEKRNQILELQQTELQKQAEQISALNQQFIRISQLLSLEGKKAFQSTFAGVNSICNSTDKIVYIGKALVKDLEAVDDATQLIESVSKQVRHLAVQAALVANQSKELAGFSQITNDISKLGSKTFVATEQVNEIASRFKARIQQLTEAANAGETTARSLIQKNQKAQVALAELEELINEQKMQELHCELQTLANGTSG